MGELNKQCLSHRKLFRSQTLDKYTAKKPTFEYFPTEGSTASENQFVI